MEYVRASFDKIFVVLLFGCDADSREKEESLDVFFSEIGMFCDES